MGPGGGAAGTHVPRLPPGRCGQPHPPGLLTGAGTAPSGLPACGWAVRGCGPGRAARFVGQRPPPAWGRGLSLLGLAGRT